MTENSHLGQWKRSVAAVGLFFTALWPLPASSQTDAENAQYLGRLVNEQYLMMDGWIMSRCRYMLMRSRGLGVEVPKAVALGNEVDRIVRQEGYQSGYCWIEANAKAAYLIGILKWTAVAEVTDSVAIAALGRLGTPYLRMPKHYYVSPEDHMTVSMEISKIKMKRVLDAGVPKP